MLVKLKKSPCKSVANWATQVRSIGSSVRFGSSFFCRHWTRLLPLSIRCHTLTTADVTIRWRFGQTGEENHSRCGAMVRRRRGDRSLLDGSRCAWNFEIAQLEMTSAERHVRLSSSCRSRSSIIRASSGVHHNRRDDFVFIVHSVWTLLQSAQFTANM